MSLPALGRSALPAGASRALRPRRVRGERYCTACDAITGHSIRDVKSILERHYLYLDPALAISAIRKLENSILHIYALFVRQFLERRVEGSKSGTERPTELQLPTTPRRSASVRRKT